MPWDLYEAIYGRRDVRTTPARPGARRGAARMLDAAHHAGSVGLMPAWNFLVLRSTDVRRQVFEVFQAENEEAADRYSGEREGALRLVESPGHLWRPR